MRTFLYPKLALSGIKKNRQLYFPYILTCIGMVLMYYIMESLSSSELLKEMSGGGDMKSILYLGKFIIAIFSLIFLIYTNSFLIRRRNKEFGLYNILGMDKHKIVRIVAWESFIVSVIGIVGGIVLGVAFSKLAELGLFNAIRRDIDYNFRISLPAIGRTVIVFAIVLFILFIKSVLQVRLTKPLDLMRSENKGEKAPKANWILAVAGFIILGVAYYLAVTIKSPLRALILFFVAVIMVIIATYLLFTAGSVAICKILQKKKNYYYKKQHFISVSSMVYRMKRNGAGLASICILSTMVLVMISSTASLNIGSEDSLNTRYPHDIEMSVAVDKLDKLNGKSISSMRQTCRSVLEKYKLTTQNTAEYSFAYISGIEKGSKIIPDASTISSEANYDNLRTVYFVSVKDYNTATSSNLSLSGKDAYVWPFRCEYVESKMSVGSLDLNILGKTDKEFVTTLASCMVVPSMTVVVNDLSTVSPLAGLKDSSGRKMLDYKWYYSYDLDGSDSQKESVFQSQLTALTGFLKDKNGYWVDSSGCKSLQRKGFGIAYGGLFFLGIMLSIVFIFAAVLIIYYKQISEGYEDRSRFDIMQKVGMTKKDIKKSINSQILTVFFAPLVFAGLHLAFAYPLIWKLLQLFNLSNLKIVITVTVIAFIIFGLFYAVVYKLTAHSYYKIVSSSDDKK